MSEWDYRTSDVERDIAYLIEKHTKFRLLNQIGEPLRVMSYDGKEFTIEVREDD